MMTLVLSFPQDLRWKLELGYLGIKIKNNPHILEDLATSALP